MFVYTCGRTAVAGTQVFVVALLTAIQDSVAATLQRTIGAANGVGLIAVVHAVVAIFARVDESVAAEGEDIAASLAIAGVWSGETWFTLLVVDHLNEPITTVSKFIISTASYTCSSR